MCVANNVNNVLVQLQALRLQVEVMGGTYLLLPFHNLKIQRCDPLAWRMMEGLTSLYYVYVE